MTDLEQLLTDRLGVRADRVPVGPAPIDGMVRAAVVRRRPWVALAAAAVVAVLVMGLAMVGQSSPPAPAPPAPAPAETRWVGHGRVQIAVPVGWPEAGICGAPQVDTVLHGAPVGRCQGPKSRPSGVDTVQVLSGTDGSWPAARWAPRQDLVIDGVPAERTSFVTLVAGETPVYGVAVIFPTEGVQLVLESSTGILALKDLLSGIRVLPADASTKRVGIGHLSVEVSASWSRDVSRCGTALEDTLLTYAVDRACRIPDAPPGVEGVRIVTEDPVLGDRLDGRFVDQVALDGVPALRTATACNLSIDGMCQARLWLPSERVGLVVTSTTDAETVDALLSTATFDRTLVAVPVPRLGNGVPLAVGRYAERLEQAGFQVDLTKVGEGTDVLTVTPEPGTVVPVGSVVRVHMGRAS